jgi:hypothetical protein
MTLSTEARTANSNYPKGGVSCSNDSFVVYGSLVVQIKFSGKSPALRVAPNRCASFYRNPKIEERMIKFKILVIIFFFSLLSCTSTKRAQTSIS